MSSTQQNRRSIGLECGIEIDVPPGGVNESTRDAAGQVYQLLAM